MVEEGQPNFIEQNLATILRQADLQTALHGKDMLPLAGEYTGAEVLKGTRAFLERYGARRAGARSRSRVARRRRFRSSPTKPLGDGRARPAAGLLHRLPGAADLQRDEAGRARARAASRQRRHRLPPVLDPAAVPHRQHDDGLRPRHAPARRRSPPTRAAQARDLDDGRRRLLAQRPDQRHRQRGLQPQRQPDHRRRQQLHLGDRRPGHAVVEGARTRRAAPATRSSRRCAASASSGCGRSAAPTTSPACATRCARR